jgi:hypothetical protein
LQKEKQRSPSASTDDGITRFVNPVSENADASIRTNFDRDSNAIDESDLHLEKQDDGMDSIGEGIHRRLSKKSFVTTANVISRMPSLTILRL